MKKWLFILCLGVTPLFVVGQYKKSISRLIPAHAKLQFAGSIGFISAGFGYESGNRRIQYDFFYGYVPKSVGGVEIHSVTAKLTWAAIVTYDPKNELKLDLLSTGFLVNYAFGNKYFLFSPANYTYSYYGFPTAAHTSVFIGGGITRKRLGIYYEIGITTKDLVSYVGNTRTLGLAEILNIGIGTRIALRSTQGN